ncbi:MAG: ABC transporter permease [Myxococcota bacterium]
MSEARTRAGWLVPGLGHLLVGEWIVGLGLMAHLVLLVGAAFGARRLPDLLYGPGGAVLVHPMVALAAWPTLAAMLWWIAYRRSTSTERAPRRATTSFVRTFSRHPTGLLGLVGVSFMFATTVLTPLLAPFDPVEAWVGPARAAPSAAFWMGTDELGRDVFSRVLYGGRISLSIGFLAVGIAASIGTFAGAVAGYTSGSWVDRALMFGVDVLLSLPRLVLLLALVGLFRPTGTRGLVLIVAILGFTAWMGISRIVRSEVMSLKQREFVAAARALGLSHTRILFAHLVPNAIAPVIVFCSLLIGGTMLAEAALSFLGLGVPPPTATWGVMVSDGRAPLRIAPWISVFPGLAIMVSVLSFNLLGDGLRDALDPKLRS